MLAVLVVLQALMAEQLFLEVLSLVEAEVQVAQQPPIMAVQVAVQVTVAQVLLLLVVLAIQVWSVAVQELLHLELAVQVGEQVEVLLVPRLLDLLVALEFLAEAEAVRRGLTCRQMAEQAEQVRLLVVEAVQARQPQVLQVVQVE